jgi:hypothetical protein
MLAVVVRVEGGSKPYQALSRNSFFIFKRHLTGAVGMVTLKNKGEEVC